MNWKYIILGVLFAGILLTGIFLLFRALSRFTRFIKGDTPAEMARYQKTARERPEPGGSIHRDIRYRPGLSRGLFGGLFKEQRLDIYMPMGSLEAAEAGAGDAFPAASAASTEEVPGASTDADSAFPASSAASAEEVPGASAGTANPAASTAAAVPAVIIVHGGSWMHGCKEDIRIIDRFLERMRREGWAVISIDYVSSPPGLLGAPSRNVRKALKWIRHNAGKYGIDPGSLGLYSFSAGSHLTMEALNASGKPAEEWRFWLSEYGPVDLTAMAGEEDSRASEVFGRFPEWYLHRHSPALHIHNPFPPVMLVHGDADQAVPLSQSENLAERLQTTGTEVTLRVIPGGGHGFFGNSQEVWMEIEDAVFPFIKKHFR